jgi:hypothetical protein
MEQIRLSYLTRALKAMSDTSAFVLSSAASAQQDAAERVHAADAQSDVRLIVHSRVVQLMLRQHVNRLKATALRVRCVPYSIPAAVCVCVCVHSVA